MAKVLVVDDEPDIVLFVQVNLELSGHEVRTAADGVAALAAMRLDRPDAVVLDVMMPRLDGWGVLDQIKSDPDESIRTIPVVLLTALDADHDRARGGIEGAIRYLAKPVGPDDLLAALDDVLGGPPEPERRKAARQEGLTSLARIERDAAGGAAPGGPPSRLTRLERPPSAVRSQAGSTDAVPVVERASVLAARAELTAKQRDLLGALLAAETVSATAAELGVSRSNVYASLRRIGRRLGVADVTELLRLLRAGHLDAALEG